MLKKQMWSRINNEIIVHVRKWYHSMRKSIDMMYTNYLPWYYLGSYYVGMLGGYLQE